MISGHFLWDWFKTENDEEKALWMRINLTKTSFEDFCFVLEDLFSNWNYNYDRL